jgi:L-fuculose-phosphate aldolase
MTDLHLIEEIQHVSLSMFRKSFFGVYHGSVSARLDAGSFLINNKEAIFDEITKESLIRLESEKPDYRWNIASIDAMIHDEIYKKIPHAKYIAYTMPPYITAYSLVHESFCPEDFFGDKFIGKMAIHDPEQFLDWYDRAPYEISDFFKKSTSHLMLIKGYGVYTYDRDLREMAKKIAILENSARLLMLKNG